MVLHQKVFLISFFVWFASLIGANLSGLMFINLLEQHTKAFDYGFAGISTNLFIGYLIFLYLFCQASRRSDLIYDANQYFCDWVWFSDNLVHRLLIGVAFLIWMIPNIILISEPMSGITWLIGIHFISSLFYWTGVIGCFSYSAYRRAKDIDLVTRV